MAVWNVINHQELSGDAASVTFSSIPASYDHLCLKISARTDGSNPTEFLNYQFNNDTGSNYGRVAWTANTSTPTHAYSASETLATYNYINGGGAVANMFSTVEAWIINYSNTSYYKQVFSQSHAASTSTTDSNWGIRQAAANWNNTAAISEIDVITGASNFVQYSTFTLYGINGVA
jgi:hypothetical protein